jgi:hypothetical protein
MKYIVVCLLMPLVMAIGGCWGKSHVSSYGVSFNQTRRSLGLPTIPSNWKLQDMGSFFDTYNPTPSANGPYHLRKRVVISKAGVVESEEDAFYSGKTFRDPVEGTMVQEEILLTYVFGMNGKEGLWRARAVLVPPGVPQVGDGVSRPISLDEADKQLAEWGLSRRD